MWLAILSVGESKWISFFPIAKVNTFVLEEIPVKSTNKVAPL